MNTTRTSVIWMLSCSILLNVGLIIICVKLGLPRVSPKVVGRTPSTNQQVHSPPFVQLNSDELLDPEHSTVEPIRGLREALFTSGSGKRGQVTIQPSRSTIERVQSLLQQYGYFRHSYNEGTVDTVTHDALKRLQEFFKLPEKTGMLDASTLRLLQKSRCGMPDVSPIAAVGGCPFKPRILHYAFLNVPPLTGGSGEAAFRSAFNTWHRAVPSVTFIEVRLTGNPDILISWVPAKDTDFSMVNNGVIAHSDFPPGCSALRRNSPTPLPLHFNRDSGWQVGPSTNGYDVETVAIHEIGHTLGLTHSENYGAVMSPYIAMNSTNRHLTPEDIKRVRALYP